MDANAEPQALEFASTWWRTQYHVEEGRIVPVWGSEVQQYDPFQVKEGVHLVFANLPLGQSQEAVTTARVIEQFCSTYGILGMVYVTRRSPSLESDTDLSRYRAPLPPLPEGHSRKIEPWMYVEPVQEFVQEQRRFRLVLEVASALRSADVETARDLVRQIGCGDPDAEPARVLEALQGWFLQSLDTHLKGVRPSPVAITDTDTLESWPVLSWRFDSLLDALYTMVVWDFQSGRFVRRCPACRRFFRTARRNQLYCNHACSIAQAKAAFTSRVRQARELQNQGMSPVSIASVMGATVEQVNTWLRSQNTGVGRMRP